MARSVRSLGSAAALLVAACSGELVNPDCCNIRLAVISPDPAALNVGQTVTLQAHLTEAPACLPADAQPANLRWASDNPTVASIDPVTGRVTAVGAGTAQINLITAVTHTFLTQSSVEVAAPERSLDE